MFGAYALRAAVLRWEPPVALRAPALAIAVAVTTGFIIALQRPVSQFIYFQF